MGHALAHSLTHSLIPPPLSFLTASSLGTPGNQVCSILARPPHPTQPGGQG